MSRNLVYACMGVSARMRRRRGYLSRQAYRWHFKRGRGADKKKMCGGVPTRPSQYSHQKQLRNAGFIRFTKFDRSQHPRRILSCKFSQNVQKHKQNKRTDSYITARGLWKHAQAAECARIAKTSWKIHVFCCFLKEYKLLH